MVYQLKSILGALAFAGLVSMHGGVASTALVAATPATQPGAAAAAAPPAPPAPPAATPAKNKAPKPANSTASTAAAAGKPAKGNKKGNSTGTNPLVIKGYRFFDSVTGEYVGLRGVNYYPRPNTGALDANNLDLFSDKFKHVWQRDLPEFVALNANAIRLYAVDPDENHHEFMCALQSAGIYVIVDLGSSCKGCEITPDRAPACYPASYKERGEKIIQQFAQYDNVLAFSGGNEINHRTGGNPAWWNAPCQKKFVRDMRAYIQSCPSMRKIPVGLVVADTERDANALYYSCRTDPEDKLENAEWYGINTYVHCDDIEDPAKAAGFNMLRDSFKDYKLSIPTLLTEFGCVSKGFPTIDGYEAQRTFHDAKFMNSPEYSEYFAGGFAFEYSTENANSKSTAPYPFKSFGPQNYGLGFLAPEGCDDVDKPCEFVRFPNFHSLATAFAETDTSSEKTIDEFEPAADRLKTSKCPAKFAKLSDFTWAGDSKKSVACPKVNRYQCPNVPLNVDIKPREAKELESAAATQEGSEPEAATEGDEAAAAGSGSSTSATTKPAATPKTNDAAATATAVSTTVLVLVSLLSVALTV